MIPSGMSVHLSNLRAQAEVAASKRKNGIIRNMQPGSHLRVTTKERREYLLAWGNEISFMYGKEYNFNWKNLGSGVWEISLVEVK